MPVKNMPARRYHTAKEIGNQSRMGGVALRRTHLRKKVPRAEVHLTGDGWGEYELLWQGLASWCASQGEKGAKQLWAQSILQCLNTSCIN